MKRLALLALLAGSVATADKPVCFKTRVIAVSIVESQTQVTAVSRADVSTWWTARAGKHVCKILRADENRVVMTCPATPEQVRATPTVELCPPGISPD